MNYSTRDGVCFFSRDSADRAAESFVQVHKQVHLGCSSYKVRSACIKRTASFRQGQCHVGTG